MCFWWKAAARLELHHKLLKIDLIRWARRGPLREPLTKWRSGHPPRAADSHRNKNRRIQSAQAGQVSAAKDYLAILSYPFTGMVTGFASLNVNLLLAARRVTSLFALALSASLASVLAWLFGPAIELESSG
jgi:hypothetical protein